MKTVDENGMINYIEKRIHGVFSIETPEKFLLLVNGKETVWILDEELDFDSIISAIYLGKYPQGNAKNFLDCFVIKRRFWLSAYGLQYDIIDDHVYEI